MSALTAPEIAEDFRCSPRKVASVARAHRIGVNLGGRAGWRFTEADKQALWEAMRPAASVQRQSKRQRQRRS